MATSSLISFSPSTLAAFRRHVILLNCPNRYPSFGLRHHRINSWMIASLWKITRKELRPWRRRCWPVNSISKTSRTWIFPCLRCQRPVQLKYPWAKMTSPWARRRCQTSRLTLSSKRMSIWESNSSSSEVRIKKSANSGKRMMLSSSHFSPRRSHPQRSVPQRKQKAAPWCCLAKLLSIWHRSFRWWPTDSLTKKI